MGYPMPYTQENPYSQPFLSQLEEAANGCNHLNFFSDVMELWAIELRKAIDHDNAETLQERYRVILDRYTQKQRDGIEAMCRIMYEGIFLSSFSNHPVDILGPVYVALHQAAQDVGTVYTPPHISNMLAQLLTTPESIKAEIEQFGCCPVIDPTVGSGILTYAHLNTLSGHGVDYREYALVRGWDMDIVGVHMSYIQLSLYEVAAILVHKNSLQDESWDEWLTMPFLLKAHAGQFKGDV